MNTYILLALGALCCALIGVIVTLETKRRELAIKLQKAQCDRLKQWDEMGYVRKMVIDDVERNGKITNREAFGALFSHWIVGVYNRKILEVPELTAKAIIDHLGPEEARTSDIWYQVILAIAKGEFGKFPWRRIEPFEIT